MAFDLAKYFTKSVGLPPGRVKRNLGRLDGLVLELSTERGMVRDPFPTLDFEIFQVRRPPPRARLEKSLLAGWVSP